MLQVKNDVVFQALFGRGRENITKAMLENILKIKKVTKELQNIQLIFNKKTPKTFFL